MRGGAGMAPPRHAYGSNPISRRRCWLSPKIGSGLPRGRRRGGLNRANARERSSKRSRMRSPYRAIDMTDMTNPPLLGGRRIALRRRRGARNGRLEGRPDPDVNGRACGPRGLEAETSSQDRIGRRVRGQGPKGCAGERSARVAKGLPVGAGLSAAGGKCAECPHDCRPLLRTRNSHHNRDGPFAAQAEAANGL